MIKTIQITVGVLDIDTGVLTLQGFLHFHIVIIYIQIHIFHLLFV